MDAERFDAIARFLSSGATRRSVFPGLIGATLAGLLGLPVQAKPRKQAKPKKSKSKSKKRAHPKKRQKPLARAQQVPSQRDCVGFCETIFPQPGRDRGQCIAAAARGSGPCLDCAGDPDSFCDGACVDLETDEDNCGACGVPCQGTVCRPANCSGRVCARTIIANCCVTNDNCSDRHPCMEETCDLATNRCTARPIQGCCRRDEECATANPCTLDACDAATNTCTHGRIDGCCRNDGDCGPCEKCAADNACVPDRAKDGTTCPGDGSQGACCDGDCRACAEGETLDLDNCACGGGGSACVCTRTALGDPCESHVDCCSGLCADGGGNERRCVDPRIYLEDPYCRPAGAFCINEDDIPGLNLCCSGVCTECACEADTSVCRELGDPDCQTDQDCCGPAVCVTSGCCLDRGDLCTANGECCSGSCEDFHGDGNRYCACGPVGAPCTNGGLCCSQICSPEGVCACSQPEDSNLDCRFDSDCCGGRCVHGLQAPHDGVDGLCCRFSGEYCEFSYECCSGSCDVAASACN